jgi:hypothetical protein
MRAWIVLLAVAGCSHKEPNAKVEKGSAVAPPTPPPVTATRADRLIDHMTCAPTPMPVGSWLGKWDGSRPFDNANPLAHRGPTRITITAVGDKLHVAEGVGAAGYQVDLVVDPDGVVARGQSSHTKSGNAVSLDTGTTSPITVTTDVAIAACFDVHKALHYWRVLDESGTGVQSSHEEDEVVLAGVVVPPPVPPPVGFRMIAEDESLSQIALAPDDIVWSTAVGVPAVSAIRAAPRKGGPMRELATGIPFVHDLVVRGDYVYFAGHESIGRVPLAGGKVETLVPDVTAMLLAVDDHVLAWADANDAVNVAPVAGGTGKTVYQAKDAQIGALTLDGGAIYAALRPIALEAEGSVMRISTTGGATKLGRVTICGQTMLVVGGAPILGTCDGTIVRVRGGVQTVARDLEDVDALAVAGNTLVFALGAGRGVVGAVPLAGGKVRTVLQGQFDAKGLAIDPKDPKTVYVLDGGWNMDDPHGRIGAVQL